MSTQQLQIPGNMIVQRSGRRIAVAASIVIAVFAGALIGRSTAPSAPTLDVRPATLLTTIGDPSLGDARRAEMFRAMNGLLPTATIQPATELDPQDFSPGSRAEMFHAMNRLGHQHI